MSSKFSAARPKRAGEAFARTHHADAAEDGEAAAATNKKVRFDVRNPSALAADSREDDDVLDADVIGRGGGTATKRGAVNIDGYDSDSDNEEFEARAARRRDEGAALADQLDNYDSKLKAGDAAAGGVGAGAEAEEEDDDMDMFGGDGDDDGDEGEKAGGAQKRGAAKAGRKDKSVRFMDKIEGQDERSKSGGTIRLDEQESSDDEGDRDLAIAEEGIDDEVGLGGLKRNAPKVEAFNMKEEQEDGAFDESGNYIRKAVDPDAVHDRWLEGVSKKEMKKAAEAHQKREDDRRRQMKEDDRILTSDLLKALALRLQRGETPIEALARLGKGQKKAPRVPKWKLKKQKAAGSMDVDEAKTVQDTEQLRIKEGIDAITDSADKLMSRDRAEIYDTEREILVREWQSETGEKWVEPQADDGQAGNGHGASKMWEFRWTDGRDDAAKQGPFDSAMMKAWQEAGYFGEGVEFSIVGEDDWSRIAHFA